MQNNKKAYPSNSSDIEWQHILPHLPPACPTGRPQKWAWRDLLDGIFYVLRTGCQWRALPADLPPWPTVYRYFRWFRENRFWYKLNDYLSVELRLQAGREPDPSAGSIDSQSVKASDTACFHGYDAGKKIKGIKRHILVDTQGLLLAAVVHSASDQDYDGARVVFERAKALGRIARLKLIWADGAYDKARVHEAAAEHDWNVQIIKRSDNVEGFQVLPRRWVIERTFAWLMKNRRLAREYERLPATAECFIYLAMCCLMLKRIANAQL